MTTRTRKATGSSTPAEKTAAKKPARAPRKPAAKRTAQKPTPSLALVKAAPDPAAIPTRTHDFVTDAQIYATHHARLAGIPIHRIRDWRDHPDNTATRPLTDGTLLHYDHTTRTLTWQGTCAMGATHAYKLTSPSTASAARVDAARCEQLHADLTTIPPLTKKELAGLGILQTPTWATKDVLGEPPTVSIPAPLGPKDRALTERTQPLSLNDIAAGLEARTADTDDDQAKEDPQP